MQVGNFGDAPVTPAASVTGDFSETDNCSVAVPGGQKCDINVVFTPTVSGRRTGTLTVSFNGNIPSQTIPLIGDAGASAVSLSPTSLTFSDQAVGTTSGVQQVTVISSGTGPLILSSIQTSAQFAATNTCGGQIAPAGACTIQVTFTPSASGPQTGTLTITATMPPIVRKLWRLPETQRAKSRLPALASVCPPAAPPQPQSRQARPPPTLSLSAVRVRANRFADLHRCSDGGSVFSSRHHSARRVLCLYLQCQRHHYIAITRRVLPSQLDTLALGTGNFRVCNFLQGKIDPTIPTIAFAFRTTTSTGSRALFLRREQFHLAGPRAPPRPTPTPPHQVPTRLS